MHMEKKKWKELKTIALVSLIWRELLFIPLFFAKYIPFRKGYDFTTLWGYADSYWPVAHRLLYPWANFDGVHYLTIAGQGYSDNGRFMPLYPILIGFFNFLTSNRNPYGALPFFAGLLLSNVFLLGALTVLYKLISLDYPNKTAIRSIFLLLLFPTSFFLGSIYSESLFLLLCAGSLYLSRKGNWHAAGFLGALASATRIVGIVLLPALLIEYFSQKKRSFQKLVWIFFTPFGAIVYAIYNYMRWGNPFYFLTAHGDLANGRSTSSIITPPQTVYRYFKMLTGISPTLYEWWIVLLEFSVFCFAILAFYVMWKKKVRYSYMMFALLGFMVPVLSGTLTGLPRYIAPLFPFFLGMGLIKNKAFYIVYAFVGVILTIVLLMLFARGYYIA